MSKKRVDSGLSYCIGFASLSSRSWSKKMENGKYGTGKVSRKVPSVLWWKGKYAIMRQAGIAASVRSLQGASIAEPMPLNGALGPIGRSGRA